MRVLLTGLGGQLGSELVETLRPLGTVTAVDRQQLDLSRPDSIREVVRATQPDWIVNAAAYTAVDRAESDAEAAHAVNAVAPGVLAQEAHRLSAGLIHYSTDYVFDGRQARPYRESDPAQPNCVYGASKRAGEQNILASGARAFVFRTSWVYEARGKNFLLTMLRLANERPALKVVGDQIGAPTRARDIAAATARAICLLQAADSEAEPGIYHLSAQGATTWHGFASRIVEWGSEMGLCKRVAVEAINTSEYPTPAQRPAYSLLCNERLSEVFGLRLPQWQDSLRRCLENLAG